MICYRLLPFDHLLRVIFYPLSYVAYLPYGLQNLLASLFLFFPNSEADQLVYLLVCFR